MNKALIDLHTHTLASGHAYSTLKENILEASTKGLMFYGVSDHAPAMPGGAHEFYFNNLRVIKENIEDVFVLKGVEANIIDLNGTLDLSEETLKGLDYVIASFHPPCIESGSKEENTNCLIEVMKNPYVKIIGHPDDSRFPLDYKRVVDSAKKYGVLLEINNSSLKPNGFRIGARENVKEMLKICKDNNVKVIFGSDAHMYYDIANFENCINIVKEVDFPIELVINYNVEDIKERFDI